MNLTNKHNLPEFIVNAILNDPYDNEGSDYTATQIVAPPRVVHLTKRHWDEIEEDAIDYAWRLYGQAMHVVIERGRVDNAFQEVRAHLKYLDRDISGAADFLNATGLLQDFKNSKAWKKLFGFKDWIAQINVLAVLFRENGFHVEQGELVCFWRDWDEKKSLRNPVYPRIPIETIPVELWPDEQAREYLEMSVELLIQSESMPDDALPECTPEEMWERPTKWAVMKQGRKSAVRVFDSEADALAFIAADAKNGNAMTVVKRPGSRVRCDRFCPANTWCSQFADYLAEGGEPEPEAEE